LLWKTLKFIVLMELLPYFIGGMNEARDSAEDTCKHGKNSGPCHTANEHEGRPTVIDKLNVMEIP
jgi:hypothetical protein